MSVDRLDSSPSTLKLRRRMPSLLLENPTEIQWILVSNDTCDLLYRIVRYLQQFLGFVDPDGGKVLERRKSGISFEATDEPAGTNMMFGSVCFDGDIPGKVLIKILNG